MRGSLFDDGDDDNDITRERTVTDPPGQLFTAEEMQAIREQYTEQLEASEARREELEWQVRVELARVRDAMDSARRVADELARAHAALGALVGGAADAEPAPQPKRASASPPPLPPAGGARKGPLPLAYKRLVA